MTSHILRTGALLLLIASASAQTPEPEEALDLARRLDETMVDVSFLETPLSACLEFLQTQTQVSVRLATNDGDTPISFRATATPLGQVLRWVAYLAGLQTELRDDAVILDDGSAIAERAARLEFFDVRQILMVPNTYPARRLLPWYEDDRGGFGIVVADQPDYLGEDELLDLVEMIGPPDNWEEDYALADARPNLLVVRNTPPVLAEIEETLAALSAGARRSVQVECWVLRASKGLWRERFAETESLDGRTILAPEEVEPLLVAAEGLSVLVHLTTVAVAGQEVSVDLTEAKEYLRDLDLEIAQGSVAYDPIIGTAWVGSGIEVTPVPSRDGGSIELDLWLQTAALEGTRTVTWPDDQEEERFPTFEIELPQFSGSELRTTVRLQDGGACAMTLGAAGANAAPGERVVFLVRASTATLASDDEESVEEEPAETEEDDPILEMLETPVKVSFLQTPFTTAVRTLQEKTGVPVVLDPSIDETALTLSFEGTLGQAIDAAIESIRITDGQELGWTARHGAVLLTEQYDLDLEQVAFRTYPIGDLITTVTDFPGRSISLEDPSDSFAGGAIFAAAEPAALLDGDAIAELIETSVHRESWGDYAQLAVLGDLLVVRNVPAAHEEIEALLQRVREGRGRLVSVQVRAYQLSEDELETVLPEGGARLDAASRARLERLGELRQEVSVVSLNSQQVSGFSGTFDARLIDFDVEVAASTASADPIVDITESGMSVDVRPLLTGGGSRAILDLKVELVDRTAPHRTIEAGAMTAAGSSGSQTTAGVDKDGKPQATASRTDMGGGAVLGRKGTIELAQTLEASVKTQLELPLGVGHLFLRSGEPLAAGELVVFAVTAREVEP